MIPGQLNMGEPQAKFGALCAVMNYQFLCSYIFIGPESDHCFTLVTNWLTDWLTQWRSVDLIDETLAFEDTKSKLVDVFTVADVDEEDRVGNSLLQIWELGFVHKAKLLLRFWA